MISIASDSITIIAEAGVNHNGSIDIACKLIDEAACAGADYVKFQTFKASRLISAKAPKAAYQKVYTDVEESQYEMIRKLELNTEAHHILIQHCRTRGIKFLSSPFDIPSITLLKDLGIDLMKIPSGEITNLPYLKAVAAFAKPIVLSTGMATLAEIESALTILIKAGCQRQSITVLHCNTEYPTPMEHVNLRAMWTIRDALKVRIGYSDHTIGIEVPIAAAAMGACVIEKHFTLDRTMDGPDHAASLEPDELKAMVSAIRNIGAALGDGIKQPSPSEGKNVPIARKSIVAACSIKRGETFTEDNLTVKRPGTGISPMQWEATIGQLATRDYAIDDLIHA